MRKMLALLLTLLCVCAAAEGSAALEPEVAALCAAAHPGYTVAAYESVGTQTALILSRDGDNILCIAEKLDGAYVLTVDNTNAVYDGDTLPSLLIDSGGDALFYTYYDVNGRASEHYHTEKSGGSWGTVDVTVYLQKYDSYRSILSGVAHGMLYYQHYEEDENGNIIRSWADAPVVVDEAFEESLLPQHFNINAFEPNPIYGLYLLTKNQAFVRSQSVAGETIMDMGISPVHTVRLFETADGGTLVRVDEWDGTSFDRAAELRFAGEAALDTYHAGEGDVFINADGMMYRVERVDEGAWMLCGVEAESGVRAIGPDYAAPDGQTTVYRNDGYIYGSSPWGTLGDGEIALEDTYEAMTARMDTAAYALVNNPNPADRLHLREKPDKGARSYGKFYNRTPVLVLERGETWTKVQIGRGSACMTGYMMTKYLAFDEAEKAALACAFPQKVLQDAYRESGVHIYAAPERTSVTERLFRQERDDFIIGVQGDDWYVVLREDGVVGYVPQEYFFDGNG